MDNVFTIDIPDFYGEDCKKFGVYHGYAAAGYKYVCPHNDKLFSRFFYVAKGEIVFNENTADMVCAPAGTIVYLPNDITYTSMWSTHEDGEYISINFTLNEFYVRLPDKICIATVDSNKVYYNLFNNALTIWTTGRPGYKLELLSEIYKLMFNLFAETTYEQIKYKHSTIYKGIIYLENHYLDDVSVEQLAKLCNISEGGFRRLFKKYKKMSPITYRNYLRIQKSKDLIQSGEYNITEAAIAVNITDICYFHKLFRQFFNCAPGEFRPR